MMVASFTTSHAVSIASMAEPLAIILAAGKGRRMASELPKVLVPVCGRPMIHYVIDAVRAAGVRRMLMVVGYRADLVRRELAGEPGLEFVVQSEQLGTGHAVMMCRERLDLHVGPVLILAGDSPLVQATSLRALLAEFVAQRPACLLGTAQKPNPAGLGRIVSRTKTVNFTALSRKRTPRPSSGRSPKSTSAPTSSGPDALLSALQQLTASNVQGEYYLTDCSRCP